MFFFAGRNEQKNLILLASDSIGVGELMKKRQEILDERFDIERKKISQKKRFYV